METLCIACRCAKWCNDFDKMWECHRKLNVELLYDPTIPLPGELKRMSTEKHIQMLIASVIITKKEK